MTREQERAKHRWLWGPRPCERRCVECGEWKHHSRFRTWKREKRGRFSTESPIRFSPTCKDCEQKLRNEKKNADRPKAIIEQRCRSAATKAGVGFEFFWTQIEFVNDAKAMHAPLGFASPEQMIHDGLGLLPEEIKLAVEWLRLRPPPNEPVALDPTIAIDQATTNGAPPPAEPLGIPEFLRRAAS